MKKRTKMETGWESDKQVIVILVHAYMPEERLMEQEEGNGVRKVVGASGSWRVYCMKNSYFVQHSGS